ncbi:MAG: Crp/Fnr family transcriptional regulator [Chitinophaga sp.]|uniref:Crp/Fnr family transcriptional regulator n=1 Tax=Chitinophaga sp. TaxID=1869181 RepID=UPI001B1BCC0A|nr:Crp/Fnr family transcriptional regulator [Chitinophaga sp.]MBO9729228.1 Crp/Fnr family transcriptional regulator [Chitinophaga sp.]
MKSIPAHLPETLYHIASMSNEAMSLFLNSAQHQIVKKGDYLLSEGQRCHAIWFIETGACRAFYNNPPKETNTSFYFENTFFTNLNSLRNNVSSDYNIQAMEAAVLWRWHKEELSRLYELSPEIVAFGRQWLEHLVIAQEKHTSWLKKNTPEERYQSILTHHPELVQRVSITHLSSYLGISRETLSRIRRRIQ